MTGVQTCALPIFEQLVEFGLGHHERDLNLRGRMAEGPGGFAGWTGPARIVHDDQGTYIGINLA